MRKAIILLIQVIILFKISPLLANEPTETTKGFCGSKLITCIVGSVKEVNND